ncbi:MAG TPA: fused MFS/spermidine synthase [Xanthomonadaceae bacterium]|jgi:predicted membrane-bound spermidine synthase
MFSKVVVGRCLLALFVLSGFAGLVYQSVWSHYLGLVLGHAAYAQALVLAIFMGGMALGAWLTSRYGVRWRRLILAYAGVEGVIGVMGLVFHPVFLSYTAFSQDKVLPGIDGQWLATTWQWLSAASLIAPQSILLGMTFPLMSGAYLRMAPNEDGRILGGLYFSNSIGAAAGALVCTFVLLPAIGMPGAVRLAGSINLLVALLAVAIFATVGSTDAPPQAIEPVAPAADEGRDARFQSWMLAAAGVTGATSFVYEVGWVRLLNQALGTTVHSFELMLATFIAGLAFGGLRVRQRATQTTNPVAATGTAQVFMGVAALLSVPLFTLSFHWVEWMMGALARNDTGYVLFSLGSAAIAMAIMFPAAFFAGMTLPLMTVALLRRGHGESSIGRVYAANTLGAIVGVFATMHLLIPGIGVALSVTLAAFADLLLGLALLRFSAPRESRRWMLAGACGAAATLASLHWGRIDPGEQVGGVYRSGQAGIPAHYVKFLRDGKTATVGVFAQGNGVAVIATNGKPDAGIQVVPGQPASYDELTMRMEAALPLAMHPNPRQVALIGWGSGMCTATFLGSPIPVSVDTIEIERSMYDGARLFGPAVERAYTDPRSHPQFDDARTWFSTGHRQFDVIASEPSNPWVSGVASLFTSQFYGLVHRHLRAGGIMSQWIQSYELDDRLLATMVAALIGEFAHVDVYVTNASDLMFVASDKPLPPLDLSHLQTEPLRSELAYTGLRTRGDYAIRRIGSERMLRAFVAYARATPHSDFYPTVSLEGPRARFANRSSVLLQTLVSNGMPVLDVLDQRTPPGADDVTDSMHSSLVQIHLVARDIVMALRSGAVGAHLQQLDPDLADHLRALLALRRPLGPSDLQGWYSDVSQVAGATIGALPASDLQGIWIDPTWFDHSTPLPAPAAAVMAAFDAAARRDVARLRPTALAALEQLRNELAPDMLREQMLVLAMLGSIGEGQPGQVGELDRTWGRVVPPSDQYGAIRGYLLAWAGTMPAKRR